MRILFLSRTFPPVVGGMERQNAAVAMGLRRFAKVDVIANRYGKKALPLFLPICLLRAIIRAPSADVIVLGDGVLGCVGWILKKLFPHKPVIGVIHGLDITYSNRLYERLWPNVFIRALDRIIAVSRATAGAATQRGIPENKIVVIPNGVEYVDEVQADSQILGDELGALITNRKVLVTVGRLVERKGIRWFVDAVMPYLPLDYVYLIAGDGPEMEPIRKQVAAHGLADRVLLLGRVSEEAKCALFAMAHLFIQPNIPVDGDMEGFGLSVLEANSYGVPVLAARLEGLCDAVHEGRNGWLVTPGKSREYIEKIGQIFDDEAKLRCFGQTARTYCKETFSWEHSINQYWRVISETAKYKQPAH